MKFPRNPLPGRLLGRTMPPGRRGLPIDPAKVIARALASAGLMVQKAGVPPNRATGPDALLRRPAMPLPATPLPEAPADGDAGQGFIPARYDGRHGARHYKLFVPNGFAGSRLPLLVMLHGCTQDPDDFASGTRMNELAQARGVIVLYPAQAPRSNVSKCWNWFQPGDQRRDRGEPAVIAGITRHVMATRAIDPDRVYIAGLSAGGAMAAIMGREYPDLYAAVGVHSGLPPGAAHDVASAFAAMKRGGPDQHSTAVDGLPTPTIVFHGDRDTTVHPGNGDRIVAGKEMAGRWQVETGVAGRAYTRRIFHRSDGRVHAEHWLVHGAAHAWSGGSADGSYTDPLGPDASTQMLRFFLHHPHRAER